MPLSKSEFVNELKNGVLYYFLSSKIKSSESHFHLCIHVRENQCIFMLCGTSRPESTTRYLDFNNISYETFVPISPNPLLNELTKDTYFHCNQLFEFDCDELYNLYLKNQFRKRGTIEECELLNIKNGIKASPILENNIINEVLTSFPSFE